MNIDDIKRLQKGMPQIWIEADLFIIESSNFRYQINSEKLDVLLRLCRRMKADAIRSTYSFSAS